MSTTPQRFLTRTFAIASVAVASLALAGCSLLGNVGSEETPGTGEDQDVFSIKVGDCLNDGGATGEVSTVPTIECSEPHDSEAFASITMDDGDFPGDQAVQDEAIAECTIEFETFVGVDYDSSELDFAYYFPTEESWANGDREILCLIVDPEGQSTGSLKGANR